MGTTYWHERDYRLALLVIAASAYGLVQAGSPEAFRGPLITATVAVVVVGIFLNILNEKQERMASSGLSAASALTALLAAGIYSKVLDILPDIFPQETYAALGSLVFLVAGALAVAAGAKAVGVPGYTSTRIMPRFLWEMLVPATMFMGSVLALQGSYVAAIVVVVVLGALQFFWSPRWVLENVPSTVRQR